MQARSFWRIVTLDNVDVLDRFTAMLDAHEVRYCVIGGQAVDPRYASFVEDATLRSVLGRELRVARADDVLQGKIWAGTDPTRRASQRQKELADIARPIEAHPQLRADVPAHLLERLL